MAFLFRSSKVIEFDFSIDVYSRPAYHSEFSSEFIQGKHLELR